MSELSPTTTEPAGANASALVRALDQYLADLQAGRPPDRAAFLAAHADLAPQLEPCLASLDFIHQTARSNAAPAQLADFRIVREIGRGGMGVVYEAEQQSLRRRVALKVLRLGGATDVEALQRFQREAETVAGLHHTNIVPLFAVGCEAGVHYYAMQFIDGRSLADLNTGAGQPAADVARWGLQAAEALAYAHERGVIHRDVKPSNLLLDDRGVVWLTDFGLARRVDEVTLTVAGVLLGTPRYMSPEQAAAAREPVDQRTDIYSLGATLYELATGRPLFDADTPAGVITQILHAEPVAPRRLRPGLPRDLETIILKCLAKVPGQRYASAQTLADDLRAFAEGRAIQARRPTLIERGLRWMRRQQRNAALVGVTVLASVLLLVGGLLALERWRHWRLGRLLLENDGPVLVGEILDPQGRTVQPRFTVPTEEPLALPAGSYRLRLGGRGFLDEMFQLSLDRGHEKVFDVGLTEQRLWPSLDIPATFVAVDLEGRHDLLLLSRTGVRRVHGGSGATLWETALTAKDQPSLAGLTWDWSPGHVPSGRGGYDRQPRLVQPAPDLDGDGVRDVVFASRRQAALVALSGRDGKLLWSHLVPDVVKQPDYLKSSTGTVVGVPVTIDVDGDGQPDLVAAFAQKTASGTKGMQGRWWVAAHSGRTGKELWRFELPATHVQPSGPALPYECRWFAGDGVSFSSGRHFGSDMLYEQGLSRRGGEHLGLPWPPALVQVGGRPVVVVVAGTHLHGLDPRHGRPAWTAHDLDFTCIRPPQVADVDGDGDDELLLGQQPEASDNGARSTAAGETFMLRALDLRERQPRWEVSVRACWAWSWYEQPLQWPVVADLDGDRLPEVLLPTGGVVGGNKWVGIEAYRGADGGQFWQRRLVESTGRVPQVDRFLVGPDVDGDGCRDVFTAVLDAEPWDRAPPAPLAFFVDIDKDYSKTVVVVDAISGKDGRPLWSARQRPRAGQLTTHPAPYLGPLQWWQVGADGWPELLVSYHTGAPSDQRRLQTTWLFSAGSGRLVNSAADWPDPAVADLDGDGLADVYTYRPTEPRHFDGGGRLHAIRGRSPEAWRRLGGWWRKAGDHDGDGIPDLLSAFPSDEQVRARDALHRDRPKQPAEHPRATVLSGRDGRVLWQAEMIDPKVTTTWERARWEQFSPASPDADLNGDGVPDLFAHGKENCNYSTIPYLPAVFTGGVQQRYYMEPLVALSGRDGRKLWTADLRVNVWMGPQLLACHDLDRDGQPEVLFVSAMDWGHSYKPADNFSTSNWAYWLTVLSNRDGRVLWSQQLGDGRGSQHGPSRHTFAHVVADVDRDGVLDLVIEGGNPDAAGDVRAYSGRDGKLLWQWLPPAAEGACHFPGRPTLALGDLDGNGHAEVVVLTTSCHTTERKQVRQHVAVHGLDAEEGRSLWSWRADVDRDFNNLDNGAVPNRIVPLIVNLDGDSHRQVCLCTDFHAVGSRIVLLDHTGHLREQGNASFRLKLRDHLDARKPGNRTRYPAVYSPHFRVWACDLDGDRREELLFLTSTCLRVTTGGLERVLWEHPLPDAECSLLEVWPAQEERPATVVLHTGTQTLGLAGPDGKRLWGCVGTAAPVALLEARNGKQPPRLVYDHDREVTVCRIALPAGPQGQAGPLPDATPFTPTWGDDPRFLRPLPWRAAAALPLGLGLPALALTLLLLAGAVVVMPALLVRLALRWPDRRLLLLVPPWLAAVYPAAHYYQSGNVVFSVTFAGWLLLGSVAGLPLAFFLRELAVDVRRGRWLRLGLVLVSVAVCSAGAAWLWLCYLSKPLLAEQHYAYEGWYEIGVVGAYGVGLALFLAAASCGFLRTIRWSRFSMRST